MIDDGKQGDLLNDAGNGADTGGDGSSAVTMPEGFEGGADAWGKLDDAGRQGAAKTAADAKAAADKIAADKAAADKNKGGKQDDGKKADALPDYAKELKLPEGVQADEVFGEAVKLFGEMKLPAAEAQKLIDFTATRDKQLVKAVNDASAKAWSDQTGKWKADSEKEFTAEDLGHAKTVLPKVFDKETVGILEGLGFTNHPGVIRAMLKVHKAIKDDTWVTGNAGAVNGSDARSHFPNSNMNP
jgi:hypothetical protein